MLTIKFPDKIKTYATSDDYSHTINVNYVSGKQELNIDAYLQQLSCKETSNEYRKDSKRRSLP